jgi:glucose/arabinose dehydrogenase
MNRSRLAFPLAILLLLSTNLPAGAQGDPAPADGPFTVAGTLPGVSLEQVATGLASPTSIAHAGDDRLFITLRDGRIVVFEGGRVLPQPFLDIRSLVTSGGERGLLGLAFHPDYAENGFFFVNYTNLDGDTVIARLQVSGNDRNRADAASRRTLLLIQQPFANHNGGQIQFGPDGYLYIGMGDGGAAFDPACRAQREDELLGKMLRIDVDQNVNAAPFYGIPADNPFRGAGNPPDEVWSSGLRNPWRFTFDRQTGDLWIADVGQGQREEINFQSANSSGRENYGWKVMEGTRCSTSEACPGSAPACNSPAFTLPVLEYDHDTGCSVTGGYVYRGNRLPQIRGAYFFGDFCSGEVWAADRQGSGFRVRRLGQSADQLSTFGEDRQGEIYLATLSGRLYRLTGPAIASRSDRVALYDPQASRFQLKRANSAQAGVQAVRFGPRGNDWQPLAGDWNGDSSTTIGFYDSDAETFRLKNALRGGSADVLFRVDAPAGNVIALAGDWDGDGDDTVGLYEPSTGTFRLKNALSGPGFDITFNFGPTGSGLIPLAGDWDGDGDDTVGVYDPASATFRLSNGLSGGPADLQFQFGNANWRPVTGDWDGDGRDGIGAYDPRTATFRLRNILSAGSPDLTFRFGPRRNRSVPLAGAW